MIDVPSPLFPRQIRASLAFWLLCVVCIPGQAATYSLPGNLGASPFNCTFTSGISYTCNADVTLDMTSIINLSSDVTLVIHGNLSIAKDMTVNSNGHALQLNVSGDVSIDKNLNATMNITATGDVSLAKDAAFTGNIAAGGNVTLAKNNNVVGNISGHDITVGAASTITGNVAASGTLSVVSGSTITGQCTSASTNYSCSGASANHLRLGHTGAGLTCSGSPLTVYACSSSDSAGTCTADTSGLSGYVTATAAGGALQARIPFAIAAGQGSTVIMVPVASPQTATFGTSGLSVVPANPTTCWTGSSTSCSHVYADSGFLFDVPNHLAEAAQAFSVSAVRKSNNSLDCTPAFSNAVVPVQFTCSYGNPASGTLPARVGGVALNSGASASAACDAGGHAVALAFNASGVAATTLSYADVGTVNLVATLATPSMTGSDSFTAAPGAFSLSGTSSGPLKAGIGFVSTVTARNSAGNATPNFGKEASPEKPLIAFSKCQPSAVGTASGVFSASVDAFSNGQAQVSATWSEVGNGDLKATLASGSYLGSGLTASGNSGTGGTLCNGAGNVGRFIPDHFDLVLVQPGSFTYSGQPLTLVTVTAMSASGTPTANYNSAAGFSKAVTLAAWNGAATAPNPGPGALTAGAIGASAFSSLTTGAASAAPVYTFASATTAPAIIRLRASDSDGVSSAGGIEGSALIRSGRLRIANAFGSSKTSLSIPVRAEYWTGNSWLLNTDDGFTLIPVAGVALSPASGLVGVSVAAGVTLAAGQNFLVLGKPSAGTGSVDLAVNLGSSAVDQSCLALHPASTGAARPWLRSRNGSCAPGYDRDPAARASFGVYLPETRKSVHVRELFN